MLHNKIKPFLPKLIFLIVICLFIATIDVLIAVKIKEVVDSTIDGNSKAFYNGAIAMIVLVLLFFPGNIIFNYFEGKFIKQSLQSMKDQYVKRLFNKNINEFQKDNNALYLSSITNDFNMIEKNFFEPIIQVISSITFFAAGVVAISLVSPVVLFVGIGIMLVNIIISSLTSKPLNKHTEHRSNLFNQYTSYVKEVLSAFHIIKTNNLSNKVKKDFREKSYQVQHKGYVIDKIFSLVYAIQNTNFSLTFFGIIIAVGFIAFNGNVTFGGVVLVVQSSDKLVWPIMRFSEAIPKLFSVKSLFKKINDSLKNHENYIETENFEGLNSSIVFNNVDFNYGENEVLKDINIAFEKNKKYLVVGPSGGGKSTVLKMLRKYFNPKSGDILIDNIPLKDIKKDQYFQHIANIEQQVFLFEDTIRNNLTLYKDYTDEEIYEAIERSGLTDFIKGLPEGLDSMIYDNGKNISGGERSRIAIARGLINKASIILLDEAFASLDAKKAKAIEQSILDLKDVTIINVSHVVFKEHEHLYDDVLIVKNKKIYA